MPQLDLNLLATLPMWLVAFLMSLTCHEAAHALAGKIGGDLTAFKSGHASLDPIPHIKRSPFGTIVVPILSFLLVYQGRFMIGWASVPYDPSWAARYPKRAALMSAAGPAANFALVLLAAAAIHGGIAAGYFAQPYNYSTTRMVELAGGGTNALTMFISILFMLNLLLGTFNLLPVPPLDGHSVVGLFLSEDAARKWNGFFSDGTFAILGLLLAWKLFDWVWPPIQRAAVNALY